MDRLEEVQRDLRELRERVERLEARKPAEGRDVVISTFSNGGTQCSDRDLCQHGFQSCSKDDRSGGGGSYSSADKIISANTVRCTEFQPIS